jgi:hypothetical protein
MRRWGLVVAVLSMGCSAKLAVPDGVTIACHTDRDCPADYACGAGSCLKRTSVPSLTVDAIARSTDAVIIPVTVYGPDVDVAVSATVLRAGEAIGEATLEPATVLAARTGTQQTLTWRASALLGSAAYVNQLRLVLTPTANGVAGPAVQSSELEFGNDPPLVSALAVDLSPKQTVAGTVVVRFVVSDTSADPAALDAFELSPAGDFSDAQPVPLREGQGNAFPSGSLSGLDTSTVGTRHSVTWDSLAAAPIDAPAARIRARVRDTYGGVSAWAISEPFALANGISPPMLTLLSAPSGVRGDVTVDYRIAEPNGESCVIAVDWSPDGVSWQAAVTASQTSGLLAGSHTFVWQSTQAGMTALAAARLRFLVGDASGPGNTAETAPFAIDNSTPLPPIEVAYFSPQDGATGVPVNTTLVVVFDQDVDPASLSGKLHLTAIAPTGDVRLLQPGASSVLNAFDISVQNLLAFTSYELSVDAGVTPPSGSLGQASALPFSAQFTTGPAPDVTPPAPVSSLLVQRNGASAYHLDWTNPPSDFAGAIVLRSAAPLAPSDYPQPGQAYLQNVAIGNATVAAVTTNSSTADAPAAGTPWVYTVFAFDQALNYSVPRAAPAIAATTLSWCPDETGTFSVSAPSADTQQLWYASASGLPLALGVLVPGSGAPSGALTPLPVGTGMATGLTYYVRPVAQNGEGTFVDVEQALHLTPAALAPLLQPVSIAPGGSDAFAVSGADWPAFEAEYDTDFRPASEAWATLVPAPTGDVTNKVVVATTFANAGEYALRVRPVKLGCAGAAPWTTSNRFGVGSFRYVTPTGAGNKSGTDPANATTLVPGVSCIAQPTQVFVAGGTYALSAKFFISGLAAVYGGYAADFSARDTQAYPSLITASLDSTYFVEFKNGPAGVTGPTGATCPTGPASPTGAVLDGFTIENLSQHALSTAVTVYASSAVAPLAPVINGNTIRSASPVALLLAGPGAPVVTNNRLLLVGPATANPTRTLDVITGAGLPLTPTVRNNVIDAGTASAGINAVHALAGTLVLDANTITADAPGVVAYGVHLDNGAGDGSVITNNVVTVGAQSGGGYGIFSYPAVVTVTNNTVRASCTGTASAYALSTNMGGSVVAGAIMANNILFTQCGGTTNYCAYDGGSTGVASLQNNLLFSCATGLFYAGFASYNFVCAGALRTASCSGSSFGAGNLSAASLAAVGFVAPTGPSGDLHLSAAAPTGAKKGGLNAGQALCGSGGTSSCGGVLLDRDGLLRTCPVSGTDCYSLGAFENDGP